MMKCTSLKCLRGLLIALLLSSVRFFIPKREINEININGDEIRVVINDSYFTVKCLKINNKKETTVPDMNIIRMGDHFLVPNSILTEKMVNIDFDD